MNVMHCAGLTVVFRYALCPVAATVFSYHLQLRFHLDREESGDLC